MKTLIIVQARMTSTRLPGKVLLPLAGQPMLVRLIERLRRIKLADDIVVATTTNTADDAIAALCVTINLKYYRGSENDVLSRYAEAATRYEADTVVRITSDCPLIDPAMVDRMVEAFRSARVDYLSNMLPPTWPYGMAVEVFSNEVLQQAHAEARQAAEREHVTPFLYWRPERYCLHNIPCHPDLSQHRWTVDTVEDYELVQRIFNALHQTQPNFEMNDVLRLMEMHPEWMSINQHILQKTAQSDHTQSVEPK